MGLKTSNTETSKLVQRFLEKDKSVREELEETKIKFEAIFTNSFDGCFILDDHFTILEMNEAASKIKPEVSIGDTFLHCLKYRDDFILQAVSGEVNIPATHVCDKEEIIIEIYGREMTYNGVKRFFIVVRDITDKINSNREIKDSLERHKSIIDSIPDLVVIFSYDGFIKFTSIQGKDFPMSLSEGSNIYSYLDSSTYLLYKENIATLQSRRVANFEYFLEGNFYSVRLTKYGTDYLVLIRDVTYIKGVEKELIYKNSLFWTIVQTVQILLNSEDYRLVIDHILEIIGKVLQVDRVYIFNNYSTPTEKYTSIVYEWVAEGISKQIDNSDLKDLPFSYLNESPQLRLLLSNYCVKGNIDDFDESTQQLLASQEIKSILLTPVFVSSEFWGFIGLDSCKQKRKFTNLEDSILTTISGLLSSYIQNLKNTEQVYLLEHTFTTHHTPMVWCDIEANIIYHNTSFNDIYTPSQQAPNLLDLNALTISEWGSLLNRLRSNSTYSFCRTFNKSNGDEITLDCTAHLVPFNSREYIFIYTVNADDRAILTEKLTRESEKLLFILNSMNLYIYVVEVGTCNILFLNSRMRDLIGSDVGTCKDIIYNSCPINQLCKSNSLKNQTVEFVHNNQVTKLSLNSFNLTWPGNKEVRLFYATDFKVL